VSFAIDIVSIGGGAGQSFKPTDISGLALWLEADKNVTGTSPVTNWGDQSGAGNDATPPVSGPALIAGGGPNSLNAIQFDGSGNSVLSNVGGNLGDAGVGQSLFVVLKCSAVTGQQIVMSTNRAETGAGYAPEINVQGNGERGILVVGQAYVQDSASSATTSWEAWGIIGNGSAQTLRVNGAVRTSGSVAPGSATNTGYILGAYATNQLFFANGSRLWGVLVYNRTLNATEIGKVENYIRGKTAIW
jgi:hypothetical protein